MHKVEIVCCQKCQTEIGRIGKIGDHECLIIGGIAINFIRGACTSCGAEFYWSISERALAELIRRLQELRVGRDCNG